MTFAMKKRINIELLIDGNKGLYIHKVDKEKDLDKEIDQKISDLSEEGKTEMAGKVNEEMKTRQPVGNDLHNTKGKTT